MTAGSLPAQTAADDAVDDRLMPRRARHTPLADVFEPQMRPAPWVPRVSVVTKPLAKSAPHDPVSRARAAGVTAVWTGDCSATVELSRLAGPHEGIVQQAEGERWSLPGRGPWDFAEPAVRRAAYEFCLVAGSQFDIYRWVNLTDLAAQWHALDLPDGVRGDWARALVAAELIRP